jgi:hypothetical protein
MPAAKKSPTVAEFLRALEHPLKQELESVRQIILGVSPAIREEIKWNAPSFYTTDHFATFQLRATDKLQLILHTGAKTKETAETGLKISDPAGLLKWLAKDRCVVTFRSSAEIAAQKAALESILREWIAQLP